MYIRYNSKQYTHIGFESCQNISGPNWPWSQSYLFSYINEINTCRETSITMLKQIALQNDFQRALLMSHRLQHEVCTCGVGH